MGARRRRPSAGLDRASILDAADRVLQRDGLAGFSMRKLAGELGTTAMAVYRWFTNKEALLDAIADRTLEGFEVPARPGASWRERGRDLAVAYRARLLGSPELVPFHLARVGVSPGALRLFDRALGVVRESGLPDVEVVRVVDAVTSFVLGFVSIEVARLRAQTAGRGYRTLVPWFLQLPKQEYPALVALASHAGDFDDALFAFGLELLLDGAAARAPGLPAREAGSRRTPRAPSRGTPKAPSRGTPRAQARGTQKATSRGAPKAPSRRRT